MCICNAGPFDMELFTTWIRKYNDIELFKRNLASHLFAKIRQQVYAWDLIGITIKCPKILSAPSKQLSSWAAVWVVLSTMTRIYAARCKGITVHNNDVCPGIGSQMDYPVHFANFMHSLFQISKVKYTWFRHDKQKPLQWRRWTA